jgi:ABC-type sulfate/molybdate transport systems ATPase subunit
LDAGLGSALNLADEATLALTPHPQQRRVAGVHEVNDPRVDLAGVLTVQAPGVLLDEPFSALAQ